MKKATSKAKGTFEIGSLVDENPSDYVAICELGTGKIIGHKYRGKLAHLQTETQETQEEEKPIEDKNQLTIQF
jgi:hypothetical protein